MKNSRNNGKALVNARSANRYKMNCPCCQEGYNFRKKERRTIKRRERQAWKKEVAF